MHCRSPAQSDEAEQVAPSTPSFPVSHAIRPRTAAWRIGELRMPARNTGEHAHATVAIRRNSVRRRRGTAKSAPIGTGVDPVQVDPVQVADLGAARGVRVAAKIVSTDALLRISVNRVSEASGQRLKRRAGLDVRHDLATFVIQEPCAILRTIAAHFQELPQNLEVALVRLAENERVSVLHLEPLGAVFVLGLGHGGEATRVRGRPRPRHGAAGRYRSQLDSPHCPRRAPGWPAVGQPDHPWDTSPAPPPPVWSCHATSDA